MEIHRIFLACSDYLNRVCTKDLLMRFFPAFEVEECSTEKQFRESVSTLASNPPALVIISVRLRWTDPHPDLKPAPEDVIAQGYYRRAGFRCRELLQKENPDIPVVIFSEQAGFYVRDELSKLPVNAYYFEEDARIDPGAALIRTVRRVLSASSVSAP